MRHDVAYVAVDAPNTGEAAVAADENGERIYSAVIAWLLTRKEIDPKRIGVQSVSLGGYWATQVAFAEAARLKLAVNWAGPLDVAWSTEQLRRALGSREYLFDLPQALMTVWGYDTPEALLAGQPRMSIVKQGLLAKPTPSMLVVNASRTRWSLRLTRCCCCKTVRPSRRGSTPKASIWAAPANGRTSASWKRSSCLGCLRPSIGSPRWSVHRVEQWLAGQRPLSLRISSSRCSPRAQARARSAAISCQRDRNCVHTLMSIGSMRRIDNSRFSIARVISILGVERLGGACRPGPADPRTVRPPPRLLNRRHR